jgi:hypothetical protein
VVLTFPCIVFINLSVSLCHVDQACSTRRPWYTSLAP